MSRAMRLVRALAIALVVVVAIDGAGVGIAAPGDGSGSLLAFGLNTSGQLGSTANNATTNPNPAPTLVGLPGEIGTVTQVAAGASHSLAVTSSGQLYAFGLNQFGQLGSATNSGGITPNPTPALVGLPGQVGVVTQVAAGVQHSLVLTSSGQLYAFGGNYYGQLGSTTNNTTDNPNPTPALVVLPGQVGSVTQIAAGGSHNLVLTSSGQLYAFGKNALGQLGNAIGNGTLNANPVPALVVLPGQVGRVTQVAGGAEHSLVVTSSGQLYTFGDNFSGELGSTTNSGTTNPNATPALVALYSGTTIDTVAQGSMATHSLALVANLAIATSALASAQVGMPYQSALQAVGGTAPLRWSADGLPAGLAIDPVSGAIGGTPSTAGSSSPTITLTDAYGSSVSHAFALDVASSIVPPPAPTKAPRLTALKQSASVWLLGSKLASLTRTLKPPVKKAGLPVGTTFSFSLDQAARLTLTFHHTAIGRRVSGRCVARTAGNAARPRCSRTLGDGTLHVQARSGSSYLHFEGRISRLLRLKAGRHSMTITATIPAGKKSPPKTLRFTIAAA